MAEDKRTADGATNNVQAAKTRLEQIAAERMSRRAALGKIGLRAGMAIFAALSVDDLARMAVRQMQQLTAGSRVTDRLSQQFRNAGVAFAHLPSSDYL